MIFEYICSKCGYRFEAFANHKTLVSCPKCGAVAERQFHATTNIHIPSYFHTSRSDIFTDKEWEDLKKDPNVERAK